MTTTVTVTVTAEIELTLQSEDRLTENQVRAAAELALEHHAAFTRNGLDVTDRPVSVHVDGYGEVLVSIPD